MYIMFISLAIIEYFTFFTLSIFIPGYSEAIQVMNLVPTPDLNQPSLGF